MILVVTLVLQAILDLRKAVEKLLVPKIQDIKSTLFIGRNYNLLITTWINFKASYRSTCMVANNCQ